MLSRLLFCKTVLTHTWLTLSLHQREHFMSWWPLYAANNLHYFNLDSDDSPPYIFHPLIFQIHNNLDVTSSINLPSTLSIDDRCSRQLTKYATSNPGLARYSNIKLSLFWLSHLQLWIDPPLLKSSMGMLLRPCMPPLPLQLNMCLAPDRAASSVTWPCSYQFSLRHPECWASDFFHLMNMSCPSAKLTW